MDRTLSAPGKLFLAGEYAVLWGGVARILAVGPRVNALVRPRQDRQVDVVLLTGGTGISRRDTTVEAVRSLFQKTIDGYGELFRSLSYAAIGPAVNLAARLCSRAEAGQVLADPRVVGLVGNTGNGYRFDKLETAELKGFARPVTIFAVTPSPGQ